MRQLLSNAILVSVLASVFGVSIAFTVESETDEVKKVASSWVALVDSGKYSESWDQTAHSFKEHVTKEQWENAMNQFRSPLGKLESRDIMSAAYTNTLPGAPDGDYVVIQYKTSFEKKKSSVETLTSMKEEDGQWKVAGYFIK